MGELKKKAGHMICLPHGKEEPERKEAESARIREKIRSF